MAKYEYKVIVKADSRDCADAIIDSIIDEMDEDEIDDCVFTGVDESEELRREQRTKILEEFAKTESGKLMDKFMKRWYRFHYGLDAESEVKFWMDVVKINKMIEKEKIQNIQCPCTSERNYSIVYFDPQSKYNTHWYLTECGMEASIDNSRNNY